MYMKKWLKYFTIIVLCASSISNAQIFATETNRKLDRSSIEVFNDIWLNTPQHIDFGNYNLGFRYSLFNEHQFGKSNFFVAYGTAISFSNMHNNAVIKYDVNGNTFFEQLPKTFSGRNLNYSTNKFTLTYIETPFEIRYRTRSVSPFKLFAGFKFGYLINHYTKYVGDDIIENSQHEIKYKEYRQRNLSRIQYGPTLRVGYKFFLFSINYNMNSIFKSEKGPQINPISIGLTFSPV